jgi:hypothetical protein
MPKNSFGFGDVTSDRQRGGITAHTINAFAGSKTAKPQATSWQKVATVAGSVGALAGLVGLLLRLLHGG